MARIDGSKGADSLFGTASDDSLFGYDGDDWLDGGLGADLMDGGIGSDSYVVDDLGDAVVEAAGAGHDRVLTALGYLLLSAHVEDLTYTGATAFTGTGNALANRIEGGVGADLLDGAGGDDTLVGRAGDDLYVVDSAGDQVIELASEGDDSVNTSLLAYALPAFVENVSFTGARTAGRTGTGNALANRIVGLDGNDVLDGGGGADLLVGGLGRDHYHVDHAGDVVEDAGSDDGDTVSTTLAEYELPAKIERLLYVGDPAQGFYGIGNDADNQMVGGEGRDVLDGRGGHDWMFGKGGNDRYYVDSVYDIVGEDPDGGLDTIFSSWPVYTLPPNVESLLFVHETGESLGATGNAANNRIFTSWGNDRLDGKGGDDVLVGGDGDDEYWVDSPGDTIHEADMEGRDTVYVEATNAYTLPVFVEDLVYLNAAGGTLTGSVDQNDIRGNLGNDTISGGDGDDLLDGKAGDDLLQGGADNDELYGNEGNDVLDGGAGADILWGMDGDDVYLIGDAGDAVTEVLFGGTDEVRTALGSRTDFAAMYVLPDNVEILTGTSAGGQGVYGNAVDNLIRMGGGNDLVVLHDGGNDRVDGGGGNDFLYFGGAFTAADRADGGAGFDTVGLLGTYSLTLAEASLTGIEKLAVYSSGSGTGSNSYALATVDGNVGAGKELLVVAQSLLSGETLFFDGSAEADGRFTILGGRGADTLAGGSGADWIRGNPGSDTLRGGGGNDVFDYLAAADSAPGTRDRILDFSAGDRINLAAIDADSNGANGNSRFAFIGAGAFTGAGGQLRVTQSGTDWVVEGDVNGDGYADLVILVATTGGHSLGAGDFWL